MIGLLVCLHSDKIKTMNENDLILNRYRVLEQLGSGGFASVYRAFDERITRRVAIKVLPLKTTAGKDASKNAEQKLNEAALIGLEEARVAAMLSHPSIVTLLDFEVDADRGVAYLIMEDIDGITVADIPSDYLTDEVISAILKAVAEALIFAHSNGVLHLDIKPANVLISHDGQVKLADFGLAQLSQMRRGRKGHGKAVAGTIGYMPLEQLSGEEVSEETDQWALAALIYELLSDEYPYHEEVSKKRITVDSMLKAQEADEVALLDLGDVVLEGIFARALARNPDARFESVKDFYDTLLPELGDRPAATAGKRELKKIVPEIASDEPDEDDLAAMQQLQKGSRRGWGGGRRTDDDYEPSAFVGCMGSAFSITLKIIMLAALITGLLAWFFPGFVQLSGNNQQVVVQVAAGVFIIAAVLGLIYAASRSARTRH